MNQNQADMIRNDLASSRNYKIIKVYKQEGITRWFWFLGGEDRSYRGKNNSSDIFYGWDKTQNKEAINKLGQKYLDLYKQ